ncbi:hypothetical protein [Pseudonocardia sp. ICBG1142]|uniref:hypothetical protein n=1 Tax=Pseudonocardia sp. ICBG1142 TaxID=2846760 RepID=UPI001CF682A9|nr:hypothetical protein [Pseudonocardia sp. ICBG1142]
MTVEARLVNADLRRKRSVDLAQLIHERHGGPVTALRAGLLAYPYPQPVPDWHSVRTVVPAMRGAGELTLVASTAPDTSSPAAGVGIWELAVTGSEPLARGEAEGWARAVFGYRCAPLVYRRRTGGLFHRPTGVEFVVFHGVHGPMHPSDVEAYGANACA